MACLTGYDPDTFKEFCYSYGYDEDSRKAEKIYNAVCEEWKNIKMLYSDEEIEKLQDIVFYYNILLKSLSMFANALKYETECLDIKIINNECLEYIARSNSQVISPASCAGGRGSESLSRYPMP